MLFTKRMPKLYQPLSSVDIDNNFSTLFRDENYLFGNKEYGLD